MTEHKHTPGPWRLGNKYKSIVADAPTGHDDESNLDAYGGHLVCESVKMEANARLIAAAPNMLKALECLYTNADLTHGERLVARKAIDKAKGEF